MGILVSISSPAQSTSQCYDFYRRFEEESSYRPLVAKEIEGDIKNLQRMADEPTEFYLDEREKALKQLKAIKGRGNIEKDFIFEPYRVVLERVIKDLEIRKTRRFGAEFSESFDRVIAKARALLIEGPKYKDTVRFMMYDFADVLDRLLIKRHPDLANKHYHKHHAEHKLEEYLSGAPDILMIFSFEFLGPDFFIKSRSAPLQLVGFDLRGLDDLLSERPHADKHDMLISEFPWHDIGHIDFMAGRDFEYINSDNKPLKRIIFEWDATRKRILESISYVRNKDRDSDLADAMVELVSELLHERGFQYSLTVLKQELETDKWVDVILKKWKNGFYGKLDPNPRLFERLAEARTILYQRVSQLREPIQLDWLRALNGQEVPVRVIYSPKLSYSRGHSQSIQINGRQVSFSSLTDRDFLETTSIKEAVTAQVSPAKNSPLNSEVVSILAKLNFLKSKRTSFTAKSEQKLNQKKRLSQFVIQKNRKVYVEMNDGTLIALDDFVTLNADVLNGLILTEAQTIKHSLLPLEIFEIDQVIGSMDRHEQTIYTLRPSSKTFESRVQLEKNPNSGLNTAVLIDVKNERGFPVQLPVSEVRFDPLQRN